MHRTLSSDAIAALQAGDTAALIAAHRRTFGGYVMEDGAGDGTDSGAGDGADQGQQDAGADTDPEGDDLADDGDDDARVRRANRQAAQYRTQLRETQQQLQQLQQAQQESGGVLDALRRALTGDTGDGDNGEAEPAEVARQATERVTTLETENAALRGELLVHELAPEHNGNPVALLDSRSFANTLHGLDPAAEDYRDQVAEAIKTAVSKSSTLRAGQASPRGGSEDAGRAGGGTVTKEQFDAMGYAERAQLFQTDPTTYRKLSA